MPRAGWWICLALTACSTRPAAGVAAGVAAGTAAASPPVAPTVVSEGDAPDDPVVAVPMQRSDAPWLEPALPGEPPPCVTCSPTTLAIGESAALVRPIEAQVFANVVGRGIVGPLAFPVATTWMGLGARNRPFVADATGALWSATDLDAARDVAKWRRVGEVAGATAWDIGPRHLVATDGQRVHVSRDEGASFVASAPLGSVSSVVVRDDGVIAAVVDDGATGRGVHLSRNGGRTWRKTALRVGRLVRAGSWLWNDERDCAAVLAADGRTWIRPTETDLGTMWGTMGWTGPTQVSDGVDAFVEPNDQERFGHPAAPPVAGHVVIRDSGVCETNGELAGVMGGVLGGIGMMGGGAYESLTGVAALRRSAAPAIPASRSELAFFRDAVCAPADGDEYGFCKPDAKLTRTPHVARIDRTHGMLDVVTLPATCDRPHRAFGARGLGVVLCREGGRTRVHTTASGSEWHDEGLLDAPAPDLWNWSAGPDGTLMVQAACPVTSWCRAFVRAPVAGGVASAWRVVEIPGAVTYRVTTSGGVVAVVQPEASDVTRMQLVHVRADAEPEQLAEVRINVEPVDVRVLDDGRVRIEARHPTEDRLTAFLVGHWGLIATPAPEERRTADGVRIDVARPIDPAIVQ